MSWSLSTTVKPDGENKNHAVVLQLQQAAANRESVGNQHCPQERDQQIDAAVQAVLDLLIGGHFITNAEEISISMSGHANKDHYKDDSWSNEFVNITVAIKTYRPDFTKGASHAIET